MNNIPAFPLHNHGTQTLGMHFTGMTLRDYFAAKAMQAMLSMYRKGDRLELNLFSNASYRMADEMMKAREL